jgi:beta-barrel assembly-enhancing protease
MSLKGSREFERQADAFAVPALARNSIDPAALERFFAIMAKEEGAETMPEWLQTHPVTSSRIESLKALRAQNVIRSKKEPLTAAEWKAVRRSCAGLAKELPPPPPPPPPPR